MTVNLPDIRPRSTFRVRKALAAAFLFLAAAGSALLPRAVAHAEPGETKPAPAVAKRQLALKIGKPGGAVTVRATVAKDGVALQLGSARILLPLASLSDLKAEPVLLRGGIAAAIVRAKGDGAEAAALVAPDAHGKAALLWSGRVDLHGDPGERVADGIEVADRDGDGSADVVVGSYDERSRICGQNRTLLRPQILDAATGQLHSASLLPLGASSTPVEQLSATARTGSAGSAAPLLRALRVVGSSSSRAGGDARFAADGNPATAWVDGGSSSGLFEFLSLRWDAPEQHVLSFAVTFAAGAQAGKISVVAEHGERLEVAFPADLKPGERQWITPKSPLQGGCFSFVIQAVNATDPKSHVAIAEIEAYTELDAGGGAAALVAALASDGPSGADATELITRAGLEVTQALLDAWPHFGPTGKRRALRVVVARDKRDPLALSLLERGLADADAEVHTSALEAAVAALPMTAALLAAACRPANPRADAVAIALARRARTAALPALVTALAAPGGVDRPALRQALQLALAHAAPGALAELAPSDKTVSVRAALALALVDIPPHRTDALPLILSSTPVATEFADRWRLVQASAAAPESADLDAWLVTVAGTATEWMLRAAAIDALSRRASPHALEAARSGLTDEYPRVRGAALQALEKAPENFELLSKSARNDSWFLVRIAALEALPNEPRATAVASAALADHTAVVRAAAIRSLRRERAMDAWPAIEPHVASAQEFPEVIGEGITFAKGLCVANAVPALQAVVVRGLRPDAWSPDQDLALSALDALVSLGGDAARWALDQARSPLVPEPVRVAIQKRTTTGGACQPE